MAILFSSGFRRLPLPARVIAALLTANSAVFFCIGILLPYFSPHEPSAAAPVLMRVRIGSPYYISHGMNAYLNISFVGFIVLFLGICLLSWLPGSPRAGGVSDDS
jgi:hypothetical protein